MRYFFGTFASVFVAHFGISVMHDGKNNFKRKKKKMEKKKEKLK